MKVVANKAKTRVPDIMVIGVSINNEKINYGINRCINIARRDCFLLSWRVSWKYHKLEEMAMCSYVESGDGNSCAGAWVWLVM